MRILVTGGAGYIGSHTVLELLEKNIDVVVIDNLCNSNLESLKRVERLTGKAVDFVYGDVRDESLLDSIFEKYAIDGVIHFAGLKAVGESVQKPIEYYDNNIKSTLALIEAMNKHNVKKITYFSCNNLFSFIFPLGSKKVPTFYF